MILNLYGLIKASSIPGLSKVKRNFKKILVQLLCKVKALEKATFLVCKGFAYKKGMTLLLKCLVTKKLEGQINIDLIHCITLAIGSIPEQ